MCSPPKRMWHDARAHTQARARTRTRTRTHAHAHAHTHAPCRARPRALRPAGTPHRRATSPLRARPQAAQHSRTQHVTAQHRHGTALLGCRCGPGPRAARTARLRLGCRRHAGPRDKASCRSLCPAAEQPGLRSHSHTITLTWRDEGAHQQPARRVARLHLGRQHHGLRGLARELGGLLRSSNDAQREGGRDEGMRRMLLKACRRTLGARWAHAHRVSVSCCAVWGCMGSAAVSRPPPRPAAQAWAHIHI